MLEKVGVISTDVTLLPSSDKVIMNSTTLLVNDISKKIGTVHNLVHDIVSNYLASN